MLTHDENIKETLVRVRLRLHANWESEPDLVRDVLTLIDEYGVEAVKVKLRAYLYPQPDLTGEQVRTLWVGQAK